MPGSRETALFVKMPETNGMAEVCHKYFPMGAVHEGNCGRLHRMCSSPTLTIYPKSSLLGSKTRVLLGDGA